MSEQPICSSSNSSSSSSSSNSSSRTPHPPPLQLQITPPPTVQRSLQGRLGMLSSSSSSSSSLCCCRRARPPPPPRQLPCLPDLNTQPIPAEGVRKQLLSSIPTSQTPLSLSSKSLRSCKPSHRAGQRNWMGVKPYPPQPRLQSATSWLIWHGPPVESTSSANS